MKCINYKRIITAGSLLNDTLRNYLNKCQVIYLMIRLYEIFSTYNTSLN